MDEIEKAEASHNAAFRALLERCQAKCLKLNARKLKHDMLSLGYMGHVISAAGIALDEEN